MLPLLPHPWKAGWKVKRGRRYYRADRAAINGKRLRRQRSTAAALVDEVRTLEARIQQHGQLADSLPTRDLWEMVECLEVCAPLGIRPLDACRQVAAQHPKGGNARTVAQAVAELMRQKRRGNRRAKYLDTLERSLTGFARIFDGRAISTIGAAELDLEIERHPKWAPGTVHGVVSNWKVLFNFARRRGYCTDNPAEKIELPAKDTPEPEIFTVDQVRRMFAHTLFADRDPVLPLCQPYLAIGIFAGVRPEEIERLEWEQVDLASATITVLGAKAKCRARRIVDLAPNAVNWIWPWQRKHGLVLRHPVAILRRAIRVAMGLKQWPHDVLRHSFGSYHFGKHRNEALVKNQMGHSDDGRMFFSHYRVLVHPKEAARFWQIQPPAGLLTA